MDRTELSAQMKGFDRRVRALLDACEEEREQPPGVVSRLVEELSSSLEELKVAEEEMAHQNRELEQAQARAESERLRYRELFLTAPEGYLLTDETGTIGEVNQAAARLLGAPRDHLQGTTLTMFVNVHDRPRFRDWLHRIQTREPSVEAEMEIQAQSFFRERSFLCRFSFWRAHEQDGRRGLLRWAVRDMTDRDRARERDEYKEQSTRKDEFLAVLAHELRNPLAAITLASDLLRKEIHGGDSKLARPTDIIRRHTTQLSRLVNDLLDVSRVYHGKVNLALMPMDLAAVVTNAVETVQPQLRQKHHGVDVVGAGASLLVNGDPLRLQQVMVNLLDNASKYSPEGGLIEVRLRRTGDSAIISVRDFGIGMPAGMIDRIFGLFEQGTSTSGLGIGLTLVRELVRLHGGTITAQSAGENQGSEFIVTLPLLDRAAELMTSVPSRPNPARSSRDPARILIVDDNRDAADLLGSSLEELGHDVAIAYSADAAMALMPGRDAALVDLAMPGMDGFELAPELRKLEPTAELFAVTGFGDDANRARAASAGFQHYSLKPVELGELDSQLRAAVSRRARAS